MKRFPTPSPGEVKTCSRCSLQSSAGERHCSHCANLSDRELYTYLEQHQRRLEAGARLGRYFAATAAVILLLTLTLFF